MPRLRQETERRGVPRDLPDLVFVRAHDVLPTRSAGRRAAVRRFRGRRQARSGRGRCRHADGVLSANPGRMFGVLQDDRSHTEKDGRSQCRAEQGDPHYRSSALQAGAQTSLGHRRLRARLVDFSACR